MAKVIVVVLGWWKSEAKFLRKYVDLFKESNRVHTVVQETMSTSELCGRPFRKNASERLLRQMTIARNDFLEKYPDKSPKFVFHAMSNNGALLYLSMQELMPHWLQNETAGAIFDSSPGRLDLNTWFGAFIESKPPPVVLNSIGVLGVASLIGLRLKLGSTLAVAKFGAIGAIGAYATSYYLTESYHKRFVNDKMRCPLLFLYSKEDKLVGYEEIEKVMAGKASRGVSVLSKCFEGSGHVAHLRMFRDEYKNEIEGFLQKVGGN